MGAEFSSVEPRPARGADDRHRRCMGPRLRHTHRWTSLVFTLTVVANFAAMSRGAVPALFTYSPLLPLLILTLTGIYMLARHHGRGRRRPAFTRSEG